MTVQDPAEKRAVPLFLQFVADVGSGLMLVLERNP
jgi:hypothetical protein